ncbi:MAG: hypothetical protein JKY65_08540, partial [Planctomycetes bacterium]|nr:hypothetical protein [Planctomycetota bacterium]
LAVWADLSEGCPRQGLASVWEAYSLSEDWVQAPRAAFTADGAQLALASPERCWVYQTPSGNLLRELPAGGEPQFLPDGRLRLGRAVFAAESSERVLELSAFPESAERDEPIRVLHDGDARVAWSIPSGAAWSLEDVGRLVRQPGSIGERRPRGGLVASGQLGVTQVGAHQVGLIDVVSGALVDQFPCGGSFRIDALALGPAGRYLAVAGLKADQPQIQLWDLRRRSLRATHAWEAPVLDVCFLPASQLLVVSDARGQLQLWDHVVGESISELPRQDPPAERVLASPDGVRLLAIRREGAKLIHLDWSLEERPADAWPKAADDLLRDFCQRKRRTEPLPADPTPADVSLWIEGSGRPTWRPRELDRLTTRLTAAGFGGLGRDRLRLALERVREGVSRQEPPAVKEAPAPKAPPPRGSRAKSSSGSQPNAIRILDLLLEESLADANYAARTKLPLPMLGPCLLLSLGIGVIVHPGAAIAVALLSIGGLFGLHHGRREQAANHLAATLGERLGDARGDVVPFELQEWISQGEDPLIRGALQRNLPDLLKSLSGLSR